MNELQAKLARRRTLNNESAEVIHKEIKKTWDVQAELAGTSVVQERRSTVVDTGVSPTLPTSTAELAKQQQTYVRDQEKKTKERMHISGGEESTFQRKSSRTIESPVAASTVEADFKCEEPVDSTAGNIEHSEVSNPPISPPRKVLQPRAVLQEQEGSGSDNDMGFGFDMGEGESASESEEEDDGGGGGRGGGGADLTEQSAVEETAAKEEQEKEEEEKEADLTQQIPEEAGGNVVADTGPTVEEAVKLESTSAEAVSEEAVSEEAVSTEAGCTITIEKGPIGIGVSNSIDPDYLVQFDYFTGSSNAKEQSAGLLKPLMVLVEVNGQNIREQLPAAVKSALADPARPLVVRFATSSANANNVMQTVGSPAVRRYSKIAEPTAAGAPSGVASSGLEVLPTSSDLPEAPEGPPKSAAEAGQRAARRIIAQGGSPSDAAMAAGAAASSWVLQNGNEEDMETAIAAGTTAAAIAGGSMEDVLVAAGLYYANAAEAGEAAATAAAAANASQDQVAYAAAAAAEDYVVKGGGRVREVADAAIQAAIQAGGSIEVVARVKGKFDAKIRKTQAPAMGGGRSDLPAFFTKVKKRLSEATAAAKR
jgi:hypothetical protein